jgi:hypothetical protein
MKITDEMVEKARLRLLSSSYHIPMGYIRVALEAAFPDEPQCPDMGNPITQPAAFGKLVVTEDMGEEYAEMFYNTPACSDGSMKIILQNFVDRHSIQPRSVKSDPPQHGDRIYVLCEHNYSPWWFHFGTVDLVDNVHRLKDYNWWLRASALHAPKPAPVDPKEAAWKEFEKGIGITNYMPIENSFKAGYEAATKEAK